MTLQDLPDIVGDNAAHQLISSVVYARFIKVTASGGTARLGAYTTVSSSRGMLIPAAWPIDIELDGGDLTEVFSLNQIGVYVPSGTTLSICYGGA